MTKLNEIKQLKLLAKRLAHAKRMPMHEALDAIAKQLGYPHWVAITAKAKQGWFPKAEDLMSAEALVRQFNPTLDENELNIQRRMNHPFDEPIKEGILEGYGYQVFEVFGDVRMEGDEWRVLIGEADYSQPVVEIEVTHKDASPVAEEGFQNAAIAIAKEEVEKIRAGIASDWPRRSTKPDAQGNVKHPIYGDRSAEWFCLHCDGKITGLQLAKSLWHCPRCSASPIDIFAGAWWLEDTDKKPEPVKDIAEKDRAEPEIRVVDSRPAIQLNDEKISLLIRTALLDDAVNTNEKMGALLAEISVDQEENDVFLSLDADYWPESKDPFKALELAKLFGLEVYQETTYSSPIFPWPQLGEQTTDTLECVQMMLAAERSVHQPD